MTETNNTVIQTECSNTTRYISINNPPPLQCFLFDTLTCLFDM